MKIELMVNGTVNNTINVPTIEDATTEELIRVLNSRHYTVIEDSLLNKAFVPVKTKSDDDSMPVSKILPKESGKVVIMTLTDLYNALEETNHCDPINSYDGSQYYVYAINNKAGTNDSNLSTAENLNKIGAAYFATKPTPTSTGQHFPDANNTGYSVFGGPLYSVYRYSDGAYGFSWWYSSSSYNSSCNGNYWYGNVPGSVSVAVVRR